MTVREFRVLVVEDDAESAELLCQVLEAAQIGADRAIDGEEALRRCRTFPYGALVLDLLLPRTNGFEILREIRHSFPSLLERTIVTTGASDRTLAGFDRNGVRRIFRKPLDLDGVVAELKGCRALARDETDGREVRKDWVPEADHRRERLSLVPRRPVIEAAHGPRIVWGSPVSNRRRVPGQ
jgi:DNA-binding response OmpR family regulator